MRPWHLGNTTVRSPFRLKDGLYALVTSTLGGNIKGNEQENRFARVLADANVVTIARPDDDISDLGRKWRSALSQLGFIYPEIPVSCRISQTTFGPSFTITPNGRRLLEAESVSAIQECFLRSLAAYYIPSPAETGYRFNRFSPLRHTLSILLELERQSGNSRLNIIEMALIVELSNGADDISVIVNAILNYRRERDASTNKRVFDGEKINEAALTHNYVGATFIDYADLNFRYLKATGLVHASGKGISIVPEKKFFIESLVGDRFVPESDESFFQTLCQGATLPTDNLGTASAVLDDLLNQARRRKIPFDMTGRPRQEVPDIEVLRHEIEELIFNANESEYAERQAHEWEEISGYMLLIASSRYTSTLSNGEVIQVPTDSRPAYFEWILWRAFLAINSLQNRPYEARRFKIDQDFLPVGTAPGGVPDMIFEFEEFILVVEVTLTTNSRQEAAEGEPVRRHVANQLIKCRESEGKPVYGLFLANRIDSNTAETFRIGVWYANGDERLSLDIVPFTLEKFQQLFVTLFTCKKVDIAIILELLIECSSMRSKYYAPQWKIEIDRLVDSKITSISDKSIFK